MTAMLARSLPCMVLVALATSACSSPSGNPGSGGSGSSGSSSSGAMSSSSGATSSSTGSSSSGATSSSGGSGGGGLVTYGEPHQGGQFHLGPVDYAETQWHNACAPGTKYEPQIRQAEGTLLAGLWNGIPDVASYCDACIWVTTAKGKSAMLRVVTYGDTSPESIDTSPEAYDLLNSGEYPRAMTWQLARCPETGPLFYEVQAGANEWWTSLWVRNARVPLAKVEVQSVNHPSYVELARGGDGTLTDASGFGAGKFSIRSTSVDGQQVIDTFDWPSSGIAGAFLTGQGNFQ